MIEIISVLLLVGVLAAVVTPRMMNVGVDAIAEADALKVALRYAQIRAMSDIDTWGIQVNANSYQLVENNADVIGATLPGESDTHTFPTGVSVTAGAATYYFNWRGMPTDSTGNTAVTTTETITVTGGQAVNISITPYTGFIP